MRGIREGVSSSKFVVIVLEGEKITLNMGGETTTCDHTSFLSALPELSSMLEGQVDEKRFFGKVWKRIGTGNLIVGYEKSMEFPFYVFQSLLSDIEEGLFIINLSTGR